MANPLAVIRANFGRYNVQVMVEAAAQAERSDDCLRPCCMCNECLGVVRQRRITDVKYFLNVCV
jgi:hypothetical protein